MALGALRLAGQFEAAAHLLKKAKAKATPDWQAIWANEEAALAWHRGNLDEAAALWQKQPDSIPALFNRGMAALFLDRAAEARSFLSQAAVQLPEASGWRHLAQLYLALAEMRD